MGFVYELPPGVRYRLERPPAEAAVMGQGEDPVVAVEDAEGTGEAVAEEGDPSMKAARAKAGLHHGFDTPPLRRGQVVEISPPAHTPIGRPRFLEPGFLTDQEELLQVVEILDDGSAPVAWRKEPQEQPSSLDEDTVSRLWIVGDDVAPLRLGRRKAVRGEHPRDHVVERNTLLHTDHGATRSVRSLIASRR